MSSFETGSLYFNSTPFETRDRTVMKVGVEIVAQHNWDVAAIY